MVEDNFKTERYTKPLNAPAKWAFFFYNIIFFIKNQIKALRIDIFYYF